MPTDQQMHDIAVTLFKALIDDLLRDAVPPSIIGAAAGQTLLTMFADFQPIEHTEQWIMNLQSTVDSYYSTEG